MKTKTNIVRRLKIISPRKAVVDTDDVLQAKCLNKESEGGDSKSYSFSINSYEVTEAEIKEFCMDRHIVIELDSDDKI